MVSQMISQERALLVLGKILRTIVFLNFCVGRESYIQRINATYDQHCRTPKTRYRRVDMHIHELDVSETIWTYGPPCYTRPDVGVMVIISLAVAWTRRLDRRTALLMWIGHIPSLMDCPWQAQSDWQTKRKPVCHNGRKFLVGLEQLLRAWPLFHSFHVDNWLFPWTSRFHELHWVSSYAFSSFALSLEEVSHCGVNHLPIFYCEKRITKEPFITPFSQ